MCPNCSVSLTYHVSPSGSFLQCHYCGYRSEVPSKCPSCGSDHLYNMGFGTQQVEKQLSDKYPAARVMRLDADTVTKKDSHDKILNAFKNHKADILVGTQMVAKGHDFPGVTLVGVILADGSLYSSDYKAKEQSFSLFTQVIGRAGRSSKRGTALIQTFSPYNEALNLAASQDYERFYDSEIALRKALLFPPFCDICVMELKDENEERLNESSEKLMKIISDLLSGEFKETKIILYGPFEAMPYKINNIYRKKCVVKFRFSSGSSRFLKEIISEFRKVSGKTLFSVDINPKNV